MLRSSHFLQDQISLLNEANRRHLAALGSTDASADDLRQMAARRRRIERLTDQLAAVGDGLEIKFEGKGLHAEGVEFRRLVKLVQPVGQALRSTARDLLLIDGDAKPDDASLLIEPVLAGAEVGSLRMQIVRPPAEEQQSMFRGLLFDRTAERFLSVLRSGRDADGVAEAIVGSVAGLRTRSLQGYKKLAVAMTETGGVTGVQWRGGSAVAVSPRAADFLAEVLGRTTSHERPVSVRGRLVGSDTNDERFHLIPDPGQDDELPDHVRGSIEPTVLPQIRLTPPDTRVAAELTEISTFSDLADKPRYTFILKSFRETS